MLARRRGINGTWSEFGQQATGRLLDYYLAREAARHQVQAPPPITVVQAPPPPAPASSGVPTGLIVAGVAAVGLLLLFK